ncbi:MAG: DUF2281 domain-containing protein [Candidatus Aminicenantes bacterium]|jgi:hypothetical protein|nr:DUF2281 domain-containing protein [Candidatus Aminicenantes bacterium]NIM77642.1 DUF2281 domain-containing protein [Candidatus Aminicenantes bacterium]NIN16954.1 DUF2281 domain-containing protein [Candidatus Aminicenantes bacterium]NIN40847.1 DUF2281 domain-containing protein [Candidatus Aminicenantes bacterium]NIN83651.1 DUF2281 domain-containing protein [Candidatus Aminicenantes bacterium]
MIEQKIDSMFHKLPFYLKREVLNYIEFLSNKHYTNMAVKKKFKFDWEGGLADVKDKITSVELQHKAMDWR